MVTRAKTSLILLPLLWGSIGSYAGNVKSVTLYTPYTEISVPPGESINYTIDVINNSNVIRTMEISLIGLPDGWNYKLNSGGWNIGKISVLPGEKKSLNLNLDVPLKIDKGKYEFKILAKGYDLLPLIINVSEQGTFKSEFISDQTNMKGPSNSSFTFNADLKNSTAEKQNYALLANAPRGWDVTLKANYKQVASVNVDPNSSTNVSIDIKPPLKVEAGTYRIPVRAVTNTTSADLELEVVITGSFDVELTTPRGLLSNKITAGEEKRVEMLVRNTGSAELEDIKFDFSAPANWDVVFEPKEVDKLQPGKFTKVFATIKADKKAIPGDYITNLEVTTPETSSKVAYRVSVETPLMWGWTGILITFISVAGVFQLFRKYGRR